MIPACLETFLVGPLPGVFEIGGVQRLVVGGVKVVNTGLQAGVHDGQILIRERHVDDKLRLLLPDKRHQFGDVVGIDPGSINAVAQLGGNGITFRFCPGCKGNFAENITALGAFVGNHLARLHRLRL